MDENVLINQLKIIKEHRIAIDQGDNYTAIRTLQDDKYNLRKQQKPKAIQEIIFTGNLARAGNTTMFFVVKETKGTILNFSEGTVEVL